MLVALPSDLIFSAIRIPLCSVNILIITLNTKRIHRFLPCKGLNMEVTFLFFDGDVKSLNVQDIINDERYDREVIKGKE